MTTKFSRRRALGTIGLGLTSPLALNAEGSSKSNASSAVQTPSIQLDFGINLDKAEIYDFVLDSTKKDFTAPPPAEQGFTVLEPAKLAGTHDVPLFAARREYYSVRERRNVVGNFSAIVTVEQPVTATVGSYLLVSNELLKPENQAKKDKIVAGFAKYDPKAEPDPIKYALANMGPDITADMFVVRASFSLHKSAAAKDHSDQRDKILAMYKGTGGGTFYLSNQESLSKFLLSEQITVIKVRDEAVGRVPEPTRDTVHERYVKDVNDPHETGSVLDDIAKKASPNVEGCEFGPRETKRIAALLAWPEFKIDWVDVRIQIGCIWVIFSIPVLRIRMSTLVLYAYVVHVQNVDQLVLDMITGCIVKAAIVGAVIGVVFADFPAALAAFEAVFEDCIYFSLGQAAVCMAPGLALLTESSSWSLK